MTDTATEAGTHAIERTLELRAPVERVWAALVEKEQLDRWWGGGSAGSFKPGSEGWFEWDIGRYAYRVERLEACTYLAYRWAREADTALDKAETTLVEFRVTSLAPDLTRVDLRESGFKDPAHRAENDGGWKEELGKLVQAVEG